MRVLIGVKGSESEAFFRQAAATLPLHEAERVVLTHVIDTGARDELQFPRDHHFRHRPLGRERSEELTRAEEERARAGLRFAAQVLAEAGVPAERLHETVLRGRPNESLRDLAEREEVDVIVVQARPGKPGPHSLGKTARFLVDHAPRAALLIRA